MNVGNIKACDQVDEFIRYKVTGFSPEFVYYLPGKENLNGNRTQIHSIDSIGLKGKFGFSFEGFTTGHYQGFAAHGNQINLPNGQIAYVTSMNVNVTEYGATNEYIRGTISGKISAGGNGAGGPAWSNFSGSFAVRNE